jgi:hypothetical protein
MLLLCLCFVVVQNPKATIMDAEKGFFSVSLSFSLWKSECIMTPFAVEGREG